MLSFFKKNLQQDHKQGSLKEVSQTKRLFFKGMATAGIAVAVIASWRNSGKNSQSSDNKNLQAAYDQDVIPGDEVLKNNGFEEISKQETEEMLQMFIDDYEQKRQV